MTEPSEDVPRTRFSLHPKNLESLSATDHRHYNNVLVLSDQNLQVQARIEALREDMQAEISRL
jgi:hypothetical protein